MGINSYFATDTKSIGEIFYLAYTKTYPPFSWNPFKKQFNHQISTTSLATEQAIKNYYQNPLVMLLSFFHLNNRLHKLQDKLTWKTIFFDWQENKSLRKNVFNALIAMTRNLIFAPLMTIRNIVKIATELLPSFLADLFENFAGYFYKKMHLSRRAAGKITFTTALHSFFFGLFTLLRFPFEVTYFVGKAITSPVKGMETAFETSQNFMKSKMQHEHPAISRLRIAAGIILGVISAAITIAAYTLFPLMLTASVHSMLGVDIGMKIGNSLNVPVLSQIGTYVMKPLLSSLATALKVSFLSGSASLATIATFAGIAMTVLGIPCDRIMDALRNWWDKLGEDPANAMYRSRTEKMQASISSTTANIKDYLHQNIPTQQIAPQSFKEAIVERGKKAWAYFEKSRNTANQVARDITVAQQQVQTQQDAFSQGMRKGR